MIKDHFFTSFWDTLQKGLETMVTSGLSELFVVSPSDNRLVIGLISLDYISRMCNERKPILLDIENIDQSEIQETSNSFKKDSSVLERKISLTNKQIWSKLNDHWTIWTYRNLFEVMDHPLVSLQVIHIKTIRLKVKYLWIKMVYIYYFLKRGIFSNHWHQKIVVHFVGIVKLRCLKCGFFFGHICNKRHYVNNRIGFQISLPECWSDEEIKFLVNIEMLSREEFELSDKRLTHSWLYLDSAKFDFTTSITDEALEGGSIQELYQLDRTSTSTHYVTCKSYLFNVTINGIKAEELIEKYTGGGLKAKWEGLYFWYTR